MRTRQTYKLALVGVAAFVLAALIGATASGQDLQSQLQKKRDRLENVHHREGVLSTTIQQYGDQIDHLIGEISVLRNREAIVQKQLDKVQAELRADRIRLDQLRHQLNRSLNTLRNRLVDIYRSGQPDLLTVMLDCARLQRPDRPLRVPEADRDAGLRRRRPRPGPAQRVDRHRQAGDRRARRHRRPARRARAHAQRAREPSVGPRQRRATGAPRPWTRPRAPRTSSRATSRRSRAGSPPRSPPPSRRRACRPRPRGPFRGESSAGFIWPVNGPVVSPFGPRSINGAYENHPGIDIAVPSGTPIHAAANGVVLFTQPEASSGGYGNYTCIDHGSGISTCYAHQSSFAVSQGQEVQQGDVIGISDCTGYCFGPHLHFEVRINGQVTDPMAYLP